MMAHDSQIVSAKENLKLSHGGHSQRQGYLMHKPEMIKFIRIRVNSAFNTLYTYCILNNKHTFKQSIQTQMKCHRMLFFFQYKNNPQGLRYILIVSDKKS